MIFFAMPKLINLISSYLLIFVFILTTLGGRSKKDLAVIFVRECSMFSSKIFIVSGFTFRPLIHVAFIFVHDAGACSNFILISSFIYVSGPA